MMWTFGPIDPPDPDAMRQRLFDMFRDTYLSYHLITNSFKVAFEVTDEGYHHCHVVFKLTTAARVSQTLLKDVKGLCHVDKDGRRPNAGVNYVPNNQSNPLKIMTNYLTSPHKSKMTDDGVLEFIPIRPQPYRPKPGDTSVLGSIEFHNLLLELEKLVRRK